jgi:hypothetical protein
VADEKSLQSPGESETALRSGGPAPSPLPLEPAAGRRVLAHKEGLPGRRNESEPGEN